MNASRVLIGIGIGLIVVAPLILPGNGEKSVVPEAPVQDQAWDEPTAMAEIQQQSFWRRPLSELEIEELIEIVVTARRGDVVFVDDRGHIERTCQIKQAASSDELDKLRCCPVGYRTIAVPRGQIGYRTIVVPRGIGERFRTRCC